MQVETDHSNHTQTGRPLWLAPVAVLRAIIATLCRLLFLRDRLRSFTRTTRFKPTWRDHFNDLRRCEWNRARMRALGVSQLLTGQPLDLSTFIPDPEAPAHFGGPCPATPYEMNRRFLSIAEFRLAPAADIRHHAQRIAKRSGIDLSGCPLRLASRFTSPALRAEEESTCARRKRRSLSSSDATRRWGQRIALTIAASSSRDGGGSRWLLRVVAARAPTPQNPRSFRLTSPAAARPRSASRGRPPSACRRS